MLNYIEFKQLVEGVLYRKYNIAQKKQCLDLNSSPISIGLSLRLSLTIVLKKQKLECKKN